MDRRLLVTGSRDWTDRQVIYDALKFAFNLLGRDRGIILTHGAARGADTLAAQCWERQGMRTHSVPANWDAFGKRAGHLRNQSMVEFGAELCLAFPIGERWSGTRDCMAQARAAGITVIECGSEK